MAILGWSTSRFRRTSVCREKLLTRSEEKENTDNDCLCNFIFSDLSNIIPNIFPNRLAADLRTLDRSDIATIHNIGRLYVSRDSFYVVRFLPSLELQGEGASMR